MPMSLHVRLESTQAVPAVMQADSLPVGSTPWIHTRSATVSSKADLDVFSGFGKHGLERRLEAEAFSGREVVGHDDVLDFRVGERVEIG